MYSGNGTAKSLDLVIRQVQKDSWGLFRLPNLEVAVDGKRSTPSRWRDGRPESLCIRASVRIRREVEVDPDGWWLVKSEVSGQR